MVKCPSCDELTISGFSKVGNYPKRRIECPNCKCKCSLNRKKFWLFFVIGLLFEVPIFTYLSLLHNYIYLLTFMVIFLIYVIVGKYYFIDLVVRELPARND